MTRVDISKLERVAKVAWKIIHVLLFLSVILLLTIPDDWSEAIKITLWTITYTTGLPVILGNVLLYLERRGWLK